MNETLRRLLWAMCFTMSGSILTLLWAPDTHSFGYRLATAILVTATGIAYFAVRSDELRAAWRHRVRRHRNRRASPAEGKSDGITEASS